MAINPKNDHPETSPQGQKAKDRRRRTLTRRSVRARRRVIDRETEQGFRGVEVDPTPNENYTLAGVTGCADPGDRRRGGRAGRKAQADVRGRPTASPSADVH
jgi:hypothetical protein